ncbi:MAG TPA: hypothetical protein VII49_05380 [Rhizomicrobium sp.]
MRDLYSMAAFVLALVLIFGLRRPILARLKRFDERNEQRRTEELQDRRDRLAHYKHTMRLAEEQVEEIGETVVPDARTGTPVTLYLFEGERFHSRDEAEAVRNESVVARAREFYRDLPAALTQRGEGKIRRE